MVGVYARHAEGPGIGGVSFHGRRSASLGGRLVRVAARAQFGDGIVDPVDHPQVVAIESKGLGLDAGVVGAEVQAVRGKFGEVCAGEVEVAQGVGHPDGPVGVENVAGVGAGAKDAKLTTVGVQLCHRGAGNDRETGVSHPEVPAVEGHVAGLLDGYGE